MLFQKSHLKRCGFLIYNLFTKLPYIRKEIVLPFSYDFAKEGAIARALSYNPQIILADEPTGNLDGETQDEIMKIFRRLADEGKCVIIVTHSPDVAKEADVKFELKRGKK